MVTLNRDILLDCTFTGAINMSMQQNFVPVIRSLKIKNESQNSYEAVEVTVSAEPPFAQEFKTVISALAPESQLELDTVNLKLIPEYFSSLTERTSGSLNISAMVNGEKTAAGSYEIALLPYDQWVGLSVMPEILTAFITPNNPLLPKIISNAGVMLEKWCDDPSFTAYQSQNPNTVRMQMAAIYAAVQQENIMYIQAPASFEPIGQRIRLIDTVLTDKMANCLDITLLYAACLEAVGLNGLLICVEGHIFAGCWLENHCFSECIQDDMSLLEKRVAEGIHEICVVECTAMSAGKNIDFASACSTAIKQLDPKTFQMIIDVKRARGGGIRPLPIRRVDLNGLVTFDQTTPLREALHGNEQQAPEGVEIYEKLKYVDQISTTKQQVWERKLLDLSLRNSLLNFRVTKNSLQLLVNDLARLEDAISNGQEFRVLPVPMDFKRTLRDSKIYETETGADVLDTLLNTEFENHRLRSFLEENELQAQIINLYRSARTSMEENGANTLFLALGFLRWYESGVSEKARYAPIVLLPVDIVRKSAEKGYIIRIRDEEPQMNVTLLELLRQDFGITIGGLDPLPTDEHGVDLGRIFSIVRQAVMDKSRWNVENLAFVGLFGFGQFIMWNDIRNRSDELRRNKIVSSLISGKLEWTEEGSFIQLGEIDDVLSPADMAVPTSADASQLTAIMAAGDGRSFVLHGPPGTGKSQTITNIIANMLYKGKTVLFIAEKMAALSVVQHRLAGLGLDPFCLELHSNKAKKKDVLNQLDKTLSLGQIKHPDSYGEVAEELKKARQSLNAVMTAIHKTRECGVSLYDAISAYEEHIAAPDSINITESLLKAATKERRAEWDIQLQRLSAAATECGDVSSHPLLALRNPAYSPALRETLFSAWQRYLSILSELSAAVKALCDNWGLPVPGQKESLKQLAVLGHLLGDNTPVPLSLYQFNGLHDYEGKVAAVCDAGMRRDALREELLSDYSEAILAFDAQSAKNLWTQAEGKWFLPKLMGRSKVKKPLKALCKNTAALSPQAIASMFDMVIEYQKEAKAVNDEGNSFSAIFGLLWNNGLPDLALIKAAYEKAAAIKNTITAIYEGSENREKLDNIIRDIIGNGEKAPHEALGLNAIWNNLIGEEAELSQQMKWEFASFASLSPWLEEMTRRVEGWLSNADSMRDWCAYVSVSHAAEECGLHGVIEALENGALAPLDISSAFARNLNLGLARQIIGNDTELSSFNGTLFESDIEHFRDVYDKFEALTRQELIATLSASIPASNGNIADSSELGILKRAIRSGGRGQSIRQLFDNIPNLLIKLSPCLLMSPISVAQYIDPSYPPFDLVIFDEASQLPTSEAVGAIARGKNLIVVGDPKQLPPTSFFTSNRIDEDNFEHEDLESILDDCLALSMPETYLRWHYRSRHESLIAFSNRQYYNNELFTFPSPNDLVSEVKFIPVKGQYDRGKTKQNTAEAEAIVAEIVRRLSDENLRAQSIGVVTFSSVQQNLIEDRLQEAFAKHPKLDEINSASHEPIFIKNLENVQGDERDIILFSVGYGPDESGKVTMNFGPLNRAGGWRRLNVAVSRARQKMVVYSTLSPEQIDPSRTSADGVMGLRVFLEYAKNGRSALPEKASLFTGEAGSLERAVAQKLETCGYSARTGIGASRYKIDVGVVHPSKRDEYILGIVVDGKNQMENTTARDKYILKDSVLTSLGWNVYHLWSIDFLENPEKEIRKIESAIKNAMEGVTVLETQEKTLENLVNLEAFERVPSENAQSDKKLIYSPYILPSISRPQEDFYSSSCNKLVCEQIQQVIDWEAPISKDMLYRRVIAAWGMTRIGARIQRRLDDLTQMMKLSTTCNSDSIFFWSANLPSDTYSVYRVPAREEERRGVEDIAKEEVLCAIDDILTAQISLPESDLCREIYKAFGFLKMTESKESILMDNISFAIEKGVCERENGRIVKTN